MDSDLRLRAKDIDPSLMGRRLREARIRAGLTQGEVAGPDASTAYISRIESGTRRPSLALLDRLALRLDTTAAALLAPEVAAPRLSEDDQRHQLELDWAELALHTGDPAGAITRLQTLVAASELPPRLTRTATYLHALALEATGETNGAISRLEDLAAGGTADLRLLEILTALSRCYRVSGDLHRAIAVGERATELVVDDALWETTEGIRLSMTVSAAHYQQGDVNHAIRIAGRAVETAERIESPQALAAAYWNLSIYQHREGSLEAALELAAKALTLLDPVQDARNAARLRTQLGRMELRADPPQIESAIGHLLQSAEELAVTASSPADRMHNLLGLARARYLTGDHQEARVLLDAVVAEEAGVGPTTLAEAHALRGHLDLADAGVAAAVPRFRAAIEALTAVGADRSVGHLWVELGQVFESLGMAAEAMVAYRGAAATQGLVARPATGSVSVETTGGFV